MRLAILPLLFVATTAEARPLRSGRDHVGALPGGGVVVLTDLCNEQPSCRPDFLDVFDGAGQSIAHLSRDGVAGDPAPPALRRRLRRAYDATLRALAATAVAPEPSTTDAMGVTSFARMGWTHAVDRDAKGQAHAHLRRADGSEIVGFEVANAYELESLTRVGDQCVLLGYVNYPSDLSGDSVHVFACT